LHHFCGSSEENLMFPAAKADTLLAIVPPLELAAYVEDCRRRYKTFCRRKLHFDGYKLLRLTLVHISALA
jgi:hypothetical protein